MPAPRFEQTWHGVRFSVKEGCRSSVFPLAYPLRVMQSEVRARTAAEKVGEGRAPWRCLRCGGRIGDPALDLALCEGCLDEQPELNPS